MPKTRLSMITALAAFAAVTCVAQVTFTEYQVPTDGSQPNGITKGPDGNLWFTEFSGNKIGKITTAGAITEFPVPTAGSSPAEITAGPDGNLWFTEYYGQKIGRITTAGVITEFPIPSGNSLPYGITVGPDGNLWFTENNGHILPASYIGRITTSGVITEFLTGGGSGSAPAQITAGSDGNLWFADNQGNLIGRITTSGVITNFPIPTPSTAGAFAITTGPDGNLWFEEYFENKIGRLTTNGVITEFAIPTWGTTSGITPGPDGNLWFTESAGNIARITSTGTITEFPVPNASSVPNEITAGPDGSLWFTEGAGNKIAKVDLGPVQWTWTQISPGMPSAAASVADVTSAYDVANNRLIAYLSTNPAVNSSPAPEVWVMTNANGLGGAPVWTQLFPTGTPPFNNGGASTIYDPATNRLVVYGGCYANCSPALSQVVALTNANGLGGTPAWVPLSVTNPQPRAGHAAVYDSLNNQMIAFGGNTAFTGSDFNDVRVLSNANGSVGPSTWTTLSPTGGPPAPRTGDPAIYDQASNRMTIFGGRPTTTTTYNDVWVLSGANGIQGVPAWTMETPLGAPPAARGYNSTAYDVANNAMFVYGGFSGNTVFGDLWKLSSANGLGAPPAWTQLFPSGGSPGQLANLAAFFDAVHQRMILYGGTDSVNHKWVWVLSKDSGQVSPTVSFTGAPATAVFNSTFTVSATTNASTSAAIAAAGACSISGNTVTMTSGTGTCDLTANWAADPNYVAASASQSTTAVKATPTISWSNPAPITYGTALGATQLNATPSVAGTLVYNPASGTVLNPGNGQTLSVAFAPSDSTDYNSANASVQINVVFTATAPASGTTCNGAYSGTFNGNLTPSAGQTCIFFGGSITGNVQQNGGNLTLVQSTVGGNVQISGASVFTIGPGSAIGGNLQIQNLPGSSAQSQVCGTSVQNDFTFQNSGSPVLIGAAAPASCAGNSIGGNLTVQNNSAATTVDGNTVTGNLTDQGNTAPTQVFGNVVTHNLKCQSNSSITGGGNTAGQKQGQCAAF